MMISSIKKQSINKEWHHATRPLCSCCGGGDWRKGYSYSKAKSRRKSMKAKKPRYKDNHSHA